MTSSARPPGFSCARTGTAMTSRTGTGKPGTGGVSRGERVAG
jgi:hypothetical protein